MASSSVVIELNDAGMQAMLRSPEIQADLYRRAAAVAASAGEGFEARSTPRARRGRAEAVTETFDARRHHQRLIAAISAARG